MQRQRPFGTFSSGEKKRGGLENVPEADVPCERKKWPKRRVRTAQRQLWVGCADRRDQLRMCTAGQRKCVEWREIESAVLNGLSGEQHRIKSGSMLEGNIGNILTRWGRNRGRKEVRVVSPRQVEATRCDAMLVA